MNKTKVPKKILKLIFFLHFFMNGTVFRGKLKFHKSSLALWYCCSHHLVLYLEETEVLTSIYCLVI